MVTFTTVNSYCILLSYELVQTSFQLQVELEVIFNVVAYNQVNKVKVAMKWLINVHLFIYQYYDYTIDAKVIEETEKFRVQSLF